MIRTLAGWALVAFAVCYLLTSPDSAAAFADAALRGLGDAARSLSSFASHL